MTKLKVSPQNFCSEKLIVFFGFFRGLDSIPIFNYQNQKSGTNPPSSTTGAKNCLNTPNATIPQQQQSSSSSSSNTNYPYWYGGGRGGRGGRGRGRGRGRNQNYYRGGYPPPPRHSGNGVPPSSVPIFQYCMRTLFFFFEILPNFVLCSIRKFNKKSIPTSSINETT